MREGRKTKIVIMRNTKDVNSPSEGPGCLGEEVSGGVVVERGERTGQGGRQQEGEKERHLVLQPSPGLAAVKQIIKTPWSCYQG